MWNLLAPCRTCRTRLVWQPLQQIQQRYFKGKSLQSQTPEVENNKILNFDELKPTDFGIYWDTEPPNPTQLQAANRFFARSKHSPVKLYSAAQFRTIPFDSIEPEVAFIGKTNVGKSSLINAIVDDEICRSGDKRGKTTEMNAYGIGGRKGGESKIVLLDMPGYGAGSRIEQGEEIMKYLKNRKQLRRVYLLIDMLHGIKSHDEQILFLLRQYAIPHQLVISKVDRVLCNNLRALKHWHHKRLVRKVRLVALQKTLMKIRETSASLSLLKDSDDNSAAGFDSSKGPPPLGEIICVSAMTDLGGSLKQSFLNIDALRWSIMRAAGFDGSI